MPPRYFTPRPTAASAPRPGPLAGALDAFVLEGAQQAGEWVVGVDGLGALTAEPLGGPASPSARVQAQLAYHEVAGGGRRRVAAEALWLFECKLVEQAPDNPGTDDPVYLYGTLVGPLGAGADLPRVEGQLAVTRSDLLDAAVQDAAHAFRFGGRVGDPFRSASARAFHLHLAADRVEEIEQGRGVVIAYPVLAPDLQAMSEGNAWFFDQMLYDVLVGLWGDVARESPPPARWPEELPVPDRGDHEAELRARGFAIEGDTAVRRRKGLLGAVLSSFVEDRRALPAEGDSDGYVELAREALTAVPGWPPARVSALRARDPTGHARGRGPAAARALHAVCPAAATSATSAPAAPGAARWRAGMDGGLHRPARQPGPPQTAARHRRAPPGAPTAAERRRGRSRGRWQARLDEGFRILKPGSGGSRELAQHCMRVYPFSSLRTNNDASHAGGPPCPTNDRSSRFPTCTSKGVASAPRSCTTPPSRGWTWRSTWTAPAA